MADGAGGATTYTTTYMVEEQQMLQDMQEVEAVLTADTSALGAVPHQVMLGGQVMSLVTGGPGGSMAAGSRVVVLNNVGGTAMLDASGRVVTMAADGSESVGVVVVGSAGAAGGVVHHHHHHHQQQQHHHGGGAIIDGGLVVNGGNIVTSGGSLAAGTIIATVNETIASGCSGDASTAGPSMQVSRAGRRTKFKVKKEPKAAASTSDDRPEMITADSVTFVPLLDEFHHLTRSQVEGLFMILGPHYTNPGRRAPLKDFVLASLVLLSSKDSYREMSERMVFKSRGWMHKTIHLFCQLMVKHLSCLIEWPSGDDAKHVVDSFESIAGIPGVIGVMDSCHMAITKAPVGKNSSFYSNHMQFHSIHLLAVADHRYKFTYINVGRPGSYHESNVFKRSSLCQIIDHNPASIFPHNTHLISNSSFPMSDKVLTPYTTNHPQSRQQKQFNGKLYHTQRTVSYAFQLLQARWQRLKCLEMQQVNNMSIAIKTCCILHNICMANSGYDNANYAIFKEQASEIEYVGTHPFEALRKRDMIAQYLEGQAPWEGPQ